MGRSRLTRRKNATKRPRINRNTPPEVLEKLKTIPFLPGGRPNPFYVRPSIMPYQHVIPNQTQNQGLDIAKEKQYKDTVEALSAVKQKMAYLESTTEAMKQDKAALQARIKDKKDLIKRQEADYKTQRAEAEKREKELKDLIEKHEREKKEQDIKIKTLEEKEKSYREKDEILHKLGLTEIAAEMDAIKLSNKNNQATIDRIHKDLEKNRLYQENKEEKERYERLKEKRARLEAKKLEAEMINPLEVQRLKDENDIQEKYIKQLQEKQELEADLAAKKYMVEVLENNPTATTDNINKLKSNLEVLGNEGRIIRNAMKEYQSYISSLNEEDKIPTFYEWVMNDDISNTLSEDSIKNIDNLFKGKAFRDTSKIDLSAYKKHVANVSYNDTSNSILVNKVESDIKMLEDRLKLQKSSADIELYNRDKRKEMEMYEARIRKKQELEKEIDANAMEMMEMNARFRATMNRYPQEELENEYEELVQQHIDLNAEKDSKKAEIAKYNKSVMRNQNLVDQIDGIKNDIYIQGKLMSNHMKDIQEKVQSSTTDLLKYRELKHMIVESNKKAESLEQILDSQNALLESFNGIDPDKLSPGLLTTSMTYLNTMKDTVGRFNRRGGNEVSRILDADEKDKETAAANIQFINGAAALLRDHKGTDVYNTAFVGPLKMILSDDFDANNLNAQEIPWVINHLNELDAEYDIRGNL